MKKKQIVIATIVVAIVVLMTTMLVACNGNAQRRNPLVWTLVTLRITLANAANTST